MLGDFGFEFFRAGTVLPEKVGCILPESFAQAFSDSPEFVGLGPGLPLLTERLKSFVPKIRLAVSRINDDVALQYLQFVAADCVLWAPVVARDTFALFGDGELYLALPKPFGSYYRWLDGIQLLRPDELPSLGWQDLPSRYSSRIELLEFARASRIPKARVQAIYRRFDSRSLQVWLRCRTGDIFFADEFNARGALYHFRAEELETVSRVRDDGFLDAFAAHVVANRGSEGFNFAEWLDACPQ